VRKVIKQFDSLAASDEADREYYRSLTPEERLEILFELIAREAEARGEAEQRLARVYRITELGKD
jgi:hypothetical protein